MKRLPIFLAVTAMLAPSVASAASEMRIGPNRGAAAVDAVVAPGPAVHFFDLTFFETGAPQQDHLYAYDLLLRATPGVSLVRAEKPGDWAFTAPDATFTQAEGAADHILARAVDGPMAPGVEIATGMNAARVFYTVDPGTAPGLYRITLDPDTTAFGAGDPDFYLDPVVDITDPGVVLVMPEPSGLALLAAAAGLLLGRRRRRADVFRSPGAG